jgi:hypothetical protein
LLTQRENWRIIRIMKKLLNITFCLCILFVSVNFAQKQPAKQTKSKTFVSKKAKNINSAKKKTQTGQEEKPNFVCELPLSVEALELSQTEIVLNCPASDESCPNNKIIEVKTIAVDSGDGGVKYVYIISAGKIIGEGANVEWDLSDAKPGSYTITAGISQPTFNGTRWDIYGQTKTKVIIVKECPNCQK